MADFTALQAAVDAQNSAIDKAVAVIVASHGPDADQPTIDALTAAFTTKTAEIDAAIAGAAAASNP